MNYFINSILLASLSKIRPWIGIFLIGFIIGISICGFSLLLNPNMGIIHFGMKAISYDTFWGTAGMVITELIKILFIAVICLLIPNNKYGIIAGKIMILLISVYLGIIGALFIKSASNDYSILIYLVVLVFAALWCLSIGTLKTNLMEKSKLAIMPVSLLLIVSIGHAFF